MRLDFWTYKLRSQQYWAQQTVEREDKNSGGRIRWRIEIWGNKEKASQKARQNENVDFLHSP